MGRANDPTFIHQRNGVLRVVFEHIVGEQWEEVPGRAPIRRQTRIDTSMAEFVFAMGVWISRQKPRREVIVRRL